MRQMQRVGLILAMPVGSALALLAIPTCITRGWRLRPCRIGARSAFLLSLTALACERAARDTSHSATAATTGVVRADTARGPRIVPLGPLMGDVQILYGNPDSAGPFVMRIRELPGTIVPPHSHPVDEHITVLQGTWYFGIGERFDSTALRALKTGDYAFAPTGTTMFAASPELAIVQVHGIGPFHIAWRDGAVTLDDSGAATTFRFKRGDRVSALRGSGVIRHGYASGALIQYEIERADGSRFMATEHDVRRS